MSGAADNSLKQWLFDSADGTARLLRFRSGHSAPPTCLKFYGTGNKLLSAGKPQLHLHLPQLALPIVHVSREQTVDSRVTPLIEQHHSPKKSFGCKAAGPVDQTTVKLYRASRAASCGSLP